MPGDMVEEDQLAEPGEESIDDVERHPQQVRTFAHLEYLEAKALEAIEEENAEDEFEGDEFDDGEGGDEDEDEEEGGDDYGDEDYGEEEEADPLDSDPLPMYRTPDAPSYFIHNENLREKFNEVEVGAFMKILGVEPNRDWKDTSRFQWRMPIRSYEDEHQKFDPYFHMVSEMEREHAEKIMYRDFRKGAELTFDLPEGKNPIRRPYRY